jgi:hypothetical protein
MNPECADWLVFGLTCIGGIGFFSGLVIYGLFILEDAYGIAIFSSIIASILGAAAILYFHSPNIVEIIIVFVSFMVGVFISHYTDTGPTVP